MMWWISNIIKISAVLIITGLLIYYFYPEPKLPTHTKIDKILVIKNKRELTVFENNKPLKTYRISIGHNPIGKKEYEGDNKTPEGVYFIKSKNQKSSCYKALDISHPDANDTLNAKKSNKKPGGYIQIHGIKNGLRFVGKFHRFIDWTYGCIAVTDNEIDELYDHTEIGTVIEIKSQ